MKKLTIKNLIIIMLLPLMFSCGVPKDEVERLTAERDSLIEQSGVKDKAINEFFDSYNEIEANLEEIKKKESIISMNTQNDMGESSKDKINNDILTIYELMLENKQKLSTMEKKLNRANIKVRKFQQQIAMLSKKIEKKDKEIAKLKKKLEDLNLVVETLTGDIQAKKDSLDKANQEIEAKDETIEAKTTQLNTAYWVIGTKKDLKEQNIINKEGTFIGLKNAKLADDLNKDYFTKIDITATKKIPVFSKKFVIVTTHPKSSYTLEGEDPVDNLIINDEKEFWSVSKYLVIVTN